jgi:ribosomal-protein-alanine N-acetyltransferase
MEKKQPPLIRKATAEDIGAIVEIEKRCFPGAIAYPKAQLAYLISKANSTSLVETTGIVMRGFVIVLYREGSRIGCIETIDVDLPHQNQGVGSRLLAAAEAHMKNLGKKYSQLEVSVGNNAAISMYQKAGYTIKQQLLGFYKYKHCGSHDAVRMIKALS